MVTDLEGLPLPELLHLAALGARFKAQHVGRRPGYLHNELRALVAGRRLGFEALLHELELAAARRELHGEQASPFEKVDRIWQVAVYHHHRHGRRQVAFGTVRNLLSKIRKNDCATADAKP